jgi:hypothetical protein
MNYYNDDTLPIGNMRQLKELEDKNRDCDECLLTLTGFCVNTSCPKSMHNGPCGGYKDGKCEVNPTKRCVWLVAFDILQKRGLVDGFYKSLFGPKDWSKANSSRNYSVK